jgi:hypothetical protein
MSKKNFNIIRNRGHDDFAGLQLRVVRQLDEGSINRVDAQGEEEEFSMGGLCRAVIKGDGP